MAESSSSKKRCHSCLSTARVSILLLPVCCCTAHPVPLLHSQDWTLVRNIHRGLWELLRQRGLQAPILPPSSRGTG